MDSSLWRENDPSGLSESPDSVDPLIAAITHNKEFSLLLKLPDEIILEIIHFLRSNILGIYCLRRVCRKLRCLIDDRTVRPRCLWTPRLSRFGAHMLYPDRFASAENTRANMARLPWGAVEKFKANIRKQTLCGPCQAAHREEMVPVPNGCAFVERPTTYIHCAGCKSHHPRNAFSQRQKQPGDRICIGREGRLRLCEHVSIGWADIEAHLTASKGMGDFLKAVSDFHVVCKHPSHNFPCKSTSRLAPSEASCNDHTRPCARLRLDRSPTLCHFYYYFTSVSMVLCWEPHSSSKILTAPENGQIEATKLRELFGGYGKNAARYIVPGPSQNTTPEMLCFDPDKCQHILYRDGKRPPAIPYERLCTPHLSSKNGQVTGTEVAFHEDHKDPSCFTGLGWTDHCVEFDEARGQSGIYVYECGEKHNSEDSTRCLMTSYRRTILLGDIDHNRPGALHPSHQWFHAIDQDSYPSIQAEGGGLWSKVMAYFDDTKSRPRCRDTACRNYYQSPGPWHEYDMHKPCRATYFAQGRFENCHVDTVVPLFDYGELYHQLQHAVGMTLLETIIVTIALGGAMLQYCILRSS